MEELKAKMDQFLRDHNAIAKKRVELHREQGEAWRKYREAQTEYFDALNQSSVVDIAETVSVPIGSGSADAERQE